MAAAPTYRRRVLTQPAERDTVCRTTGEFDVSASLSPPWRQNDRVLPTVLRSTHLRLSRTDWPSAASGSNGEHRLQRALVGADGKPWIESAPVRLFPARHGGGRQAPLSYFFAFSPTGAPEAFQALKPPSMCATWARPMSCSVLVASAERQPAAQNSTSCLSCANTGL